MGAWKGTNRSNLYKELGWESLSDRRRVRRILLFYKIVNNSTPQYLKDKITVQRPVQDGISPPLFEYPCAMTQQIVSKIHFPTMQLITGTYSSLLSKLCRPILS